MEATHDIDFSLWCLKPRRPVRVYSQVAWGERQDQGVPDTQVIVITMDDGVTVTISAGWSLPPGYPNFSTTWIEFLGTEGALIMDASHKDIVLNTIKDASPVPSLHHARPSRGQCLRRPDEEGATHFFEAVAYDRPVMVDRGWPVSRWRSLSGPRISRWKPVGRRVAPTHRREPAQPAQRHHQLTGDYSRLASEGGTGCEGDGLGFCSCWSPLWHVVCRRPSQPPVRPMRHRVLAGG